MMHPDTSIFSILLCFLGEGKNTVVFTNIILSNLCFLLYFICVYLIIPTYIDPFKKSTYGKFLLIGINKFETGKTFIITKKLCYFTKGNLYSLKTDDNKMFLFFFFPLFCLVVVLGIELMALSMTGKYCTTELYPHHQINF